MSGHYLSLLGCSCFLTFVGHSQASFISATLLQVFLVNFHGFMLHCQHDSSGSFMYLLRFCARLLRVLQVTLTAPCSTIIATLLQVFLVTFVALCCTVSTTLFRILHVTFVASCMTFLRVFHVAVMASCCTVSTALL